MTILRAFVLASILGTSGSPVFAGDNQVANPSFEEADANGFPIGWGARTPDVPADNPLNLVKADRSMYATDPTIAKTGQRSMRIASTVPVRCSVTQYVPFKVGQQLKVSAWIKGADLETGDDQGALVRLDFLNSDPAVQSALAGQEPRLKPKGSTFDWTYLSANVTVPAGVQSMPIECYLWRGKGTVWFDDVSVEVVGGPAADGPAKDPADKARYAAANAQLPPPAPGEKRVVFIGDSITDRWKLDTYFPGEGFINRGIGGQTTSQIYARFGDDALALKPRVIWILAGTNDLGGGVPPGAIVGNIRAMVQSSEKQGIKVIVCSLLPTSDYHQDKSPNFARTVKRPLDKIVETNKELAAMCSEEKATYLDLFSLVRDSKGQMGVDLSDDGLHPNDKGYKILAPAVDSAIKAAKG